MTNLSGRHALVTGGGRGLGKVMAAALVKAGARVTLTASRSIAQLEQTATELNALGGGEALALAGDVSDADVCTRIAERAAAALGPIDILINNAGRGPLEQGDQQDRADLWAVDPERYAAILMTNIAGPWFMARAIAPGMVARGFGRIINISTSRPTMLYADGGPYGPSKAALEAQSRIWAKRLAGTGVTVNILLPGGAADTDFIAGARGQRPLADWPSAAGRMAEGEVVGLLPPEVMVAPILWLASDASSQCTGERLVGANWPPYRAIEDAFDLSRASHHGAPCVG